MLPYRTIHYCSGLFCLHVTKNDSLPLRKDMRVECLQQSLKKPNNIAAITGLHGTK